MSITITYFVHGTTTDNETKSCTGWLDGELSEKGIIQSKELTEQIGNKQFDVIITSDLKRAIDSAKLTWHGREDIIHDSRIRECNYGKYNGAHKQFVVYEEHIEEPFKDGECMKDVEKRVKNLIQELKQKYDEKQIAIVAHRAPQLALEVITKDITWEQAIEKDWRKQKAWKPGWKYVI